jgi:dihydropteroate synthase
LRKHIYWKLLSGELALGETPLVAAVIPVSQEAAPNGEKYLDADRAYARALQMEEAGAAFVELAPETLRPGIGATGEEEQLHRMVPVMKRLRGNSTVPIVVRTTRALVAQRAIENGASAIHDPSALTGDITMAKVVADARVGLILGHMRGAPEGWLKQAPIPEPASVVARDLRAAVHRAQRANLDRKYLLLNPGLGLGKRKEESAAVMASLSELTKLEAPLAVYVDMPGVLSLQPIDSDVCVVASVLAGAYLIGAFDVARTMELVKSAEAIYAAQREPEPEPPPPPAPRRR